MLAELAADGDEDAIRQLEDAERLREIFVEEVDRANDQ